ncbi:hypothetical protein K8T06_10735 [bacterium]|nr:hypothetical protein [bacterium]
MWNLERIRPVILIILAINLVSVVILCVQQGPPTWDGGDHSFHALQIHQAISSGDFNLFKQFTLEQTLWPFLHSWISGVLILLTSPTFLTLRLISLLFGILTVLITAGYTHRYWQLNRDRNSKSLHTAASPALLSAFILAGSPLLILYSIQPMLEIFGAAFTMACLWAVAESRTITANKTQLDTTKKYRHYFNLIAGILLLLTFFLKYVYALLLILTLGTVLIIQILGNRHKSSWNSTVIDALTWFGPCLLGIAAWFSIPSARNGFLACLDNPDMEFHLLDPVNLLIYPITILLFYISTPVLGLLAGYLSIRAHRYHSSPFTSITLIYTITTITLLTVYRYKLIRAPFTVIPCLAFLAAIGIYHYFQNPAKNQLFHKIITVSIGLSLVANALVVVAPSLILDLNPLWRNEKEYMLNCDIDLDDVLTEIGSLVDNTNDLAIIGEFNEVSSLQLSYYICRENDEILRRLPSMFAWNQPRNKIDLAGELNQRKFNRCLILSVSQNSIHNTLDYQERFSWMSRNLVFPDKSSPYSCRWKKSWANGINAEFWER